MLELDGKVCTFNYIYKCLFWIEFAKRTTTRVPPTNPPQPQPHQQLYSHVVPSVLLKIVELKYSSTNVPNESLIRLHVHMCTRLFLIIKEIFKLK